MSAGQPSDHGAASQTTELEHLLNAPPNTAPYSVFTTARQTLTDHFIEPRQQWFGALPLWKQVLAVAYLGVGLGLVFTIPILNVLAASTSVVTSVAGPVIFFAILGVPWMMVPQFVNFEGRAYPIEFSILFGLLMGSALVVALVPQIQWLTAGALLWYLFSTTSICLYGMLVRGNSPRLNPEYLDALEHLLVEVKYRLTGGSSSRDLYEDLQAYESRFPETHFAPVMSLEGSNVHNRFGLWKRRHEQDGGTRLTRRGWNQLTDEEDLFDELESRWCFSSQIGSVDRDLLVMDASRTNRVKFITVVSDVGEARQYAVLVLTLSEYSIAVIRASIRDSRQLPRDKFAGISPFETIQALDFPQPEFTVHYTHRPYEFIDTVYKQE